MAHQKRDEMKDYLFQAILSLQSLDDCYNFFDDLCTIKEVSEMAKRMCGAKMLAENREVLRRLDEAGVEPPVKMDGKTEGTDNG